MRIRIFREAGESLLLRLAFLIVPLLPRSGVARLARALGAAAYRASGRLRRVALANLDLALGGERTPGERAAIARESFRTSALVILDLLWFGRRSERRVRENVRFDVSCAAYFDTAPLIGVSAHIGNWEIMGQALALRGAPAVSVAAPLSNRAADRILNRIRGRTGQGVAYRRGAVRRLLQTLRRGGRVGLIMDQNTLPSEGGEFVTLFGVPAPVSRAAAALRAKTGAPVMFMFCTADDDGRYTVRGLPLFAADDRNLTRTLALTMEDVIRKYPGQWMWTYKRWKYVPPGADRTRYPFYARPVCSGDRTPKTESQAGAVTPGRETRGA
ncbi:MAG: lysophospholipid acyltransferase family protein [Lentisphaerae bacterium]|nr:lysophospholipid acyltransferase family protein [Lentisphaerota bacterium]